ncbi:uncharacterized protein [Aegilops tauschii subsp. strangulata]|uniref:uncharacterized protein n=1 Tax=Aegilops tauschii subsp. strangulata TaxID=200361 RepID=UPI003CC8AE4D
MDMRSLSASTLPACAEAEAEERPDGDAVVELFYFICCKYNVQHHLDVVVDPTHESIVWRNDDLTIVLCMDGVIAEELQDLVNQLGCAIILGSEFRNMVQCDLSIAQYTRRLKVLVGVLGDISEHITNQTITLQLIRGLSHKLQARSRLLLEEIAANECARLDGHPKASSTTLNVGQAAHHG